MTIELLQTLSLVAYVLAGVFLLVAIALFFLLEVPKLFGDVTGATARKAIESIRQQNESTGNKAYKPSPVNLERGKVTDKISQSGKLIKKDSGMGVSSQTEKFNTAELTPQSNETTVLTPGSGETTVLTPPSNETTVLGGSTVVSEMPGSGDTTVLSQDQIMGYDTQASYGTGMTVDVEMGFLGSSEIIE